MRANIVVAVGVMGEREDVERFMEMMTIDFSNRCVKAAERIFGGRIQVLDLPEVESEVQQPT